MNIIESFNLDELLMWKLTKIELNGLIDIILIISNADWKICDSELEIITSFFSMYIDNSDFSYYIDKTTEFSEKTPNELETTFLRDLSDVKDISVLDKNKFMNWLILLISSDDDLDEKELFYIDRVLSNWWMEDYFDE